MAPMTPEKLREWLEWADRLKTADLDTRDDYRVLTLRLRDDEIQKMGEFYKRALRDNDIQMVRQWMLSHRGEVPMTREEAGIRNLLHFWRHLNSQSCVPFNKAPVLDVGEDCAPIPDWSKLPQNMQVLAGAALMCSKHTYSSSPEGRENIVLTTTREERMRLEKMAAEVRKIGHKKIYEWVSGRILYHVEAYLLSNLLSVLDALELPYYAK